MGTITKVITRDGSITYHNSDVDEHYHTLSGAFEEAVEKHLIPSTLLDKITTQEDVVIADVCFGLGYNSIAALARVWEVNPSQHITLFAFENDPEILSKIKEIDFPQPYHYAVAKLLQLLQHGTYEDDTLSATFFLGDAQEELKRLANNSVDVVFFDPFSPKKQPDMWTIELFSTLYAAMKQGGVLTTYSCARIVREHLAAAGFTASDGPVVGRTSPSTIAKK
jgi:tRNA U34 5-methylaminomethyl-2-thiouridine-forming methyltransferase MnmC